MKIVFMGTPKIAVPALRTLLTSGHRVIAVVTQPDQKSGRGMSVTFSPVKQVAVEADIPCYQPERVSQPEVLDFLESLGADIFVVTAYAQKLPDRLLTMAPYGCINLHPSLLPKYRGSGPLRGPILNGDEETGVTIMKVSSEWDAGDILLQERFPLDPAETSQTLEEKSAVLGAELLLKTIDGLEAGTIIPVPQDASKATYLKQIKKEEGRIDFSRSATEIERLIRSCVPWPSAFTTLDGKTFKIWEAQVVDALSTAEPGTIVQADRHEILIQTGEGLLKPLSVQLEGKKRMSIEEFLRGKPLKTGVHFG